METTAFNEVFSNALEYVTDIQHFMSDIWAVLPVELQNLFFALFILVFGLAIILFVIRILI